MGFLGGFVLGSLISGGSSNSNKNGRNDECPECIFLISVIIILIGTFILRHYFGDYIDEFLNPYLEDFSNQINNMGR